MIRRWRKLVQIIVFAGMFVIPVLNIFEITFIKGTFYSIDIGDIAAADPLAIFQAILASKTINLVMLTSIVIPILLMLLLGRIWCSWMCPYYFLVEFIPFIKNKLKIKSKTVKYSEKMPHKTNIIRFLTIIFAVFIAGIAGIPLLNLVSAPGVISSQALVLIKFHYLTFEAVFIVILLFFEFFYSKFWCRFFCPQGIFLSLFRIRRGLRVEKVVDACSSCNSCIRACPMLLNPMKEGLNYLCHNCGDCIDACPDNKKKDTLRFRI